VKHQEKKSYQEYLQIENYLAKFSE